MMNKNLLINGEFNIAQRGTSFDSTTTPKNDDATYLLDRWILLSGANDVADVSQATDAPQGSVYAQKAVVQTVNEKFGFLQIIENANCQNIIGDVASLSFQAKTGANAIRNIRAAILSWSGTKDTVTSDVVSAWNAEGTDPTLVTDWTYENIAFDIPLTSSYQTFAVPNISIDTANTKNVAVFIWVDDTNAAVGDELFLGQVQLEKGSAVSDYEHRQIGEELILSQRYFWPMDNTNGAPIGVAALQSTTESFFGIFYPIEMRVAPIASFTNPYTASWRVGGGSVTLSTVTTGTKSTRMKAVSSTLVAGDSLLAYMGTSKNLTFDAEI
jgi:hypothetical protein